MKKPCASCGKPAANISIGGTMICRQCEPDVIAEIDRRRSAGKPVNVAHIARAMYRAEHSGGNYILRDIPADLWIEVKHRAIDGEMSIRDFVFEAIR